jgi:hypothetical protein
MKHFLSSLLTKIRNYIAPLGYEDERGFHLGNEPREW